MTPVTFTRVVSTLLYEPPTLDAGSQVFTGRTHLLIKSSGRYRPEAA